MGCKPIQRPIAVGSSADYIFGGMSDRLDLPPGRFRHG